jgi:hypothetical protein
MLLGGSFCFSLRPSQHCRGTISLSDSSVVAGL